MDDPIQESTTDDGRSYAEERRARRHRGRVIGYPVCIALWLLSAVPLALLSSDDGGGAGIAAAYLAAGFGIAVVIRGLYALVRKRNFWSPWLFLIAAVLALMSYIVQSAGDEVASSRSPAVAESLASSHD
jgi:hypothetical protein